jgi:hypothetical protein
MWLPSFLPALKLGKSLHIVNISYSTALRILEQISFPLDHSTYYNIQFRPVSADLDEFTSLVVALKDAGFIFKYQVKEEMNPVNRIIINQ